MVKQQRHYLVCILKTDVLYCRFQVVVVNVVKEKEILFGRNGLFTLFAPLIVKICVNHTLYPVMIQIESK